MSLQRIGIAFLLTALLSSVALAAEGDADRQTLTVGSTKRTYVVRVPENGAKNVPKVPLVLVLHGGGGNAANAEKMTGFTEKARKEGFIVVYPQGSGSLKTVLLTWNAGHCCGYAMKQNVDDVGFIRALIDELVRTYPIDPHRIYATGMSNGGMMTHRLGIELSDRVAAIAPVVGTLFGDEKKPAHPVPALMINGALDQHVPPAGGPPGGRGANAWDGTPTRPTQDQAAFWAAADGCAESPAKVDSPKKTEWRYLCPSGQAVTLILMKDNGHAWPGGQPGSRQGDLPSTSLDATDTIWAFFKAHSK
jgi:polyhydroxybutyrate depolymerase